MAKTTPNLDLYEVDPASDGSLTFNIQTMLNDNFDKIDSAIPAAQAAAQSYTDSKFPVQASELSNGAATDAVIGNRTGDPTLASPSSTGTMTQLFGWLMGRVKAISGTTNWYDPPDINLAALSAHKSRHAIGGADVLLPSDIGAETPSGAQAKAATAQTAAGSYTDSSVAGVKSDSINYKRITSMGGLY
ncbi:hypothetical protein Desaci_1318 [Desulfosporosinus acidiphilus SJ4]|uniref:Uncharacterized protein n=1 Tax=Desulfosporosinus acidiphilus (strain DSM 22704 / JCM 16185 / SJ4) TaxID=646529 RepID=I4D3H0_DESAJ|nr:hypothetical protein [Desulfosporosinus acidiphilus]AFM40344.1 hypothetical protein Desaci_1318 [Desulfosporosinus acidiphilus SJ4]